SIFEAVFKIWSRANEAKFQVIYSTIGRRPFCAAPTAIAVNPSSEIGVSITLFSPNSSSIPWLTLYAPLYSATSSPIKKTFASRLISSFIASRNASLNAISLMYKKLIGKNIGYGANEQNSLFQYIHEGISSQSLRINFFKILFLGNYAAFLLAKDWIKTF